mgnify:CR=1 FL=1
MAAELITRDDYARLPEFDALFIRDTTFVDQYTYRFSRRAAGEGLVVIDDPQSIVRCTNKVYLAELLARHKVPIPKTIVAHAENASRLGEQLGFPCVLKKPDSSTRRCCSPGQRVCWSNPIAPLGIPACFPNTQPA